MARMEANRSTNKTYFGRTEGDRPPGRPRCRFEDNIKMDLKTIGSESVDFNHQA